MHSPLAIGLLALATTFAPAAFAELTQRQLDAAGHVFVGDAECEFKQTVTVRAVEGKPGHFELTHKKARYVLISQETTTGAVRLEDPASGLVWIQIPAKSMLLNSKLGQRVVDSCQHTEQRMEAALVPATNSFGLSGSTR